MCSPLGTLGKYLTASEVALLKPLELHSNKVCLETHSAGSRDIESILDLIAMVNGPHPLCP